MARFEGRQTVRARREDVFALVADLMEAPSWDPSIRSVDVAHIDGTWDVVHGFYGRSIDVRYCIPERRPDRIEFSGQGRRLTTRRSFELESDEAGTTTITYRFEATMRGPMRLFDKGLNAALEGTGARTLERLVERLGDPVTVDG